MTESSASRVRVLSNPGVFREGDNPFLRLLFSSYDESVELIPFSWKRALTGDYDVLHVHWLEYLVRSERPAPQLVKRLLFAALLVRLRLGRIASVWTVHNDEPHDRSGSRVERWLLGAWQRQVTHRVFLTAAARAAAGSPVASSVILHGHYRPTLTQTDAPADAASASTPRILHFGHLRPYKGIESLIDAFATAWPASAATRPHLAIVGRPKEAAYGDEIEQRTAGVPGITLERVFVTDEELEQRIRESDLVVLPYRKMYNSGAVLLALSIGRRVLVPDSATMRELAGEVGDEWVRRFEQPFEAEDLRSAVEAPRPAGLPDLSTRDWPAIGRRYSDLFRSLATTRRG